MKMNPLVSPLLTDLYQLTMLQGYVKAGMYEEAVFEFFVRSLPEGRSFLVAAGLETFLDFLEGMHFSEAELQYLADTGRFSRDLVDYLSTFRFSGDVYAMPEGTVFFANEPIIRVIAPMPEAQLIETRLINLVHFETLIASKAARCTLAAAGRATLVDFGLRRAHGAEAGLLAARATYLAGFVSTSTVLAEPLFGIPISGTMAHSFVEAHEDEGNAFLSFAEANPDNAIFLIDTYDTRRGAEKAIEAAGKLTEEGIRVRAVRIDSGDLLTLSKDVRQILDRSGFKDIQIFVSGNLDEYAIRDLLSQGAPIDGFGVGTKLDTSADAPYLDCAYKLMEYAGKPRFKKSRGKATLPGRKEVFRQLENGKMTRDIVTIEGDAVEGNPLLEKVMSKGRRISQSRDLKKIAAYLREQLKLLPPHLYALETTPLYPVEISPALSRLKEEAERMLGMKV
ncbi:MAG: nicotinate phosphoribosyltransferase [Syntrophales bacterium]|nr:nicotinate phosphoribosyltransferase [Syntrophales bacterium]